jgi:hypothetical protein
MVWNQISHIRSKLAMASNPNPSFDPQPEPPGHSRVARWMPGVVLIVIGLAFLASNFSGFQLRNWWALFILIPAFASFGKALEAMRREGEMTREVWGALSGGAILLLIAGAFLFNLNWGLIWPIFLIIGGLGMLLGARGAW